MHAVPQKRCGETTGGSVQHGKKELRRKGARLLSAVNQRLLYVVRRCELSCEHDRYVAATRRYRGAIRERFGCVLADRSTSRLCPRHHFTDGHGILLPCSDNPSRAARHFTNFTMHFVFHAATELGSAKLSCCDEKYFSHRLFGFVFFFAVRSRTTLKSDMAPIVLTSSELRLGPALRAAFVGARISSDCAVQQLRMSLGDIVNVRVAATRLRWMSPL